MLIPRHREDLGFGDIEFLSMLPAVHFHSSLLSTHDVINVTPFNHNVHHRGLWDRSSLWQFEASSGNTLPAGTPPTVMVAMPESSVAVADPRMAAGITAPHIVAPGPVPAVTFGGAVIEGGAGQGAETGGVDPGDLLKTREHWSFVRRFALIGTPCT